MNPSEVKHNYRSPHKKNAECPHYKTCMDNAAYAGWFNWTCQNCDHRHDIEELDIMEILPVGDETGHGANRRVLQKSIRERWG